MPLQTGNKITSKAFLRFLEDELGFKATELTATRESWIVQHSTKTPNGGKSYFFVSNVKILHPREVGYILKLLEEKYDISKNELVRKGKQFFGAT